MKYIDADRLRAEITKERKSIEGLFIEGDNNFYDGQDDAYNHVLALIDSLQQEQPEVDLDADIEMEWDSFNKHLDKSGEESEEVVWLNWYSFDDLARYFYNIGRNARKED